jgi:hypothetical protein
MTLHLLIRALDGEQSHLLAFGHDCAQALHLFEMLYNLALDL